MTLYIEGGVVLMTDTATYIHNSVQCRAVALVLHSDSGNV